MTADALILVVGLGLLWKGADATVNSALAVARRLNVSEIAIGLTLVSVGTSLPELVVNVVASLRGSADLAIANVLGSNIANILLILGVAALVCALPIRDTTLYSEIPFSMTAALLVGFLANAHILSQESTPSLSRLDGAILLGFFGLFGAYIYRAWGAEQAGVPEGAPPRSLLKPLAGAGPLPFDVVSNVDLVAILAATALLLFAVASGKPSAIDRREGGIFLLAYAGYMVFVIQRG